MLFPNLRVVIRGGGDLASGVAYRLYQTGFPVIILERAQPLFVRRAVSFGNAIFAGGAFEVEGIRAVIAKTPLDVDTILADEAIPILVDEVGAHLPELFASVLVDARMQKHKLDTTRETAPLVIALGPGYVAGHDCHAVIETNRGHRLGRVIWNGSAQANTGTPGLVAGVSAERVLRAPIEGFVTPARGVQIGSQLKQGDLIAMMGKHEIRAAFDGALRGLVHESIPVWAGLKIGDLDPRNKPENCFTISDKSLAIGGGVLEAIMTAEQIRQGLRLDASI